MRTNPMLAKLNQGQVATSFWMNLGDVLLVENVARWGAFDGIVIDGQHGYWSEDSVLHAMQVIGPTDTTPIVRVYKNDFGLIGRALDTGAMGVVVPLVNSAEEAEAVVRATKYPPEGGRSAGGTRLSFYGEDYFTAANPEIMTIVMLETGEAVDRAEEIIGVPGVDVGFIGPADLAISLGCYPERGPAHEEAMLKVLEAGNKVGKPVGLLCLSIEEALKRREQGFRFLSTLTDYFAFKAGVTLIKEALDGE